MSRSEKVLAEHSSQKNIYTDIRDVDDLLDILFESFDFPEKKRNRAIELIEARMAELMVNEDDFDDLTDYRNHVWNVCNSDRDFELSVNVANTINGQVWKILSEVSGYPRLVSYYNYSYSKSFCGIMTYKDPSIPRLVKKRMAKIASETEDFNQLILYWNQCHGRLRIMNYGLHGMVTNRIKGVLVTVNKNNISESFLDVVERDKAPEDLKFYFTRKVEELYNVE